MAIIIIFGVSGKKETKYPEEKLANVS